MQRNAETTAEMSTTEVSPPEPRLFPGQKQSSEQTTEEEALALDFRHLGFDLKPGQDNKGDALIWAVSEGLLEQVHLLLRAGPTEEALRHTNEWDLTPTHLAAYDGKLDILQALIEAGADITLRTKNTGITPLHCAAIKGHCEVAKLLLANGSDPSWTDNDGRTASHRAARHNQCDMLQALAAAGDGLGAVDRNGSSLLHAAALGGAREAFEMLVHTRADTLRWKNDIGWTPVHVAIVDSSVEMVKVILDVAAGHKFQDTSFNIDGARFDDGVTPLIQAAGIGSQEVVELLLDYGANIHTTDHLERSALHSSVSSGHTEVVRALIRRGADVNARHRGDAMYAVLDAVRFGHTETLHALLEAGARLSDVTTDEGYTALHIAASQGHLGLLRRLLNKNLSLDINAKTVEGSTPVNTATYAGRVDVVRMLLDRGANASIVDSAGWTPLHWAVEGNHPRIVKILFEHGADPSAESADGDTPLSMAPGFLEGTDLEHMEMALRLGIEDASSSGANKIALKQLLSAAEFGNLDLITSLLQDGGVSVNLADEDGYTSLLFASENGQHEAVRLLIRMGGEVNAKNAVGENCIWLASRYGHEAVVRTLLENGADVDSADELEQTAISAAAEGGHMRVVESLLEKGADVGIRTSYGETVHRFAAKGGHDDVVHVLQAHEAKNRPQMTSDLPETSSAPTPENGPQHAVDIMDGNSGGTTLGLEPYPESGGSPQAAVSSVASDGEIASLRSHDGVDADGSDGGDAYDHYSEDSLVSMAFYGMNAAVARLIRAGHAFNKKDQHGYLALGMAAAQGHVSTVRTLLDHGFDPDLQDDKGRTALWLAAYNGRHEVAQVLIDAGANLEIVDNYILCSPLMNAAHRGHIKVLRLLLNAGASKQLVSEAGFSELGFAVIRRQIKVVELLLESGANVEGGSDSKETPLFAAVDNGDTKMAHLLLQAGASMKRDTEDVPFLCIAAQRGYEDMVKSFLEHGAEVDESDDEGCTPLLYAAAFGHTMVARILIEMGGANSAHRDENNWTAQSHAKQAGHEDVASLLRHASRLRINTASASGFRQLDHYTYSPISKPSCIRVLDLHPGQEDDALSFDLYEADMVSNPSYEALSYEWKDKMGSIAVLCNGKILLVTPNLKLALQNIRLKDKARTLWIDAVCINQEDVEERSSQVRMMTTIYKKASTVLMWLGEDIPETEEAVASIPAVLSAWARLTADDIFSYTRSSDAQRVREGRELCEQAFAAVEKGKSYSLEASNGAFELLCRSYFTRAWIYQELVLAGTRGLVLCGRHRVRWWDFLHFIVLWAKWKSIHNYPELDIVMHIAEASAQVSGRRLSDIKIAMQALRYLNCGDPRDKIFAVLSVVDPWWMPQLAPDYSRSVQQVYTDAARALVTTTLGLGFWQGMNHPAAKKIPGLPSWVTDWTCISARYSELDEGAVLPSLFTLPPGRHAPSLVRSQFETTDTTLYADSYLIGEIAFSITMRAGDDIYQTIIRPLVESLAALGLSIFDRCPCPGTLSYLLGFCRFLTSSRREVSHELFESQAAFLAWKIIADPNTPEASRKVPPELNAAVQEFDSRDGLDVTQVDQEAHGICFEMETMLRRSLGRFAAHYADSLDSRRLPSCDLYCTKSGHLGVAGEGTAESGLVLALLQGFQSVAMMRKKKAAVDDEWYEFVDGADILELDWRSCQTVEDVPIKGKMERLKIL